MVNRLESKLDLSHLHGGGGKNNIGGNGDGNGSAMGRGWVIRCDTIGSVLRGWGVIEYIAEMQMEELAENRKWGYWREALNSVNSYGAFLNDGVQISALREHQSGSGPPPLLLNRPY